MQHACFVAEGPKLLSELLRSDFEPEAVYATRSWLKGFSRNNSSSFNILEISEKELGRISSLVSPNQVLSVVKTPSYKPLQASELSGLILVLDGIRDPGNMGTIIRLADWYGIRQLICSDDCVEAYNPKVVQATMGSLFRVQLHYVDLPEFLGNSTRKLRIFGTAMEGENIYCSKLPDEALLLIGSESHGIRHNIREFVDVFLSIPSFEASAESLNAAVATGIACSEFRRLQLMNRTALKDY